MDQYSSHKIKKKRGDCCGCLNSTRERREGLRFLSRIDCVLENKTEAKQPKTQPRLNFNDLLLLHAGLLRQQGNERVMHLLQSWLEFELNNEQTGTI